ncbi:MAG: DinB family protein [Acidobacteria bacterium]|nr:DinB family protein [Acidobacteriota bacterium]
MQYTCVADIYDDINETRRRLVERVESLAGERRTARASENVWTVAEIVEHLSITERGLLGVMTRMLDGVESAAGGQAASPGGASGPAPMQPFSLDAYVERARGQKYEAPEFIRPTGAAAVADSLASLAKSRAALENLRPRFERADLSAQLFPHPAFGPLNLYQWLAFIGIHEARHLAQIERMLADEGEG